MLAVIASNRSANRVARSLGAASTSALASGLVVGVPSAARSVVTSGRVDANDARDSRRYVRSSEFRSGSADDGPILAVAIEPSRLAAGLVDATGEVLVRDRISTPSRDVWRALERLIRRVIAAAPTARSPTRVGVSCAGRSTSAPARCRRRSSERGRTSRCANTWRRLAGSRSSSTRPGRGRPRPNGGSARRSGWRAISRPGRQTVESACVIDGVRLSRAHGNAGSIAHIIVEPEGRRAGAARRVPRAVRVVDVDRGRDEPAAAAGDRRSSSAPGSCSVGRSRRCGDARRRRPCSCPAT